MAWSESYPVNFAIDGDTTSEAIQKFINEIDDIYEYLNRVRSLDTGTTAPADPETNALWIDTSGSPYVLKRYTGSTWTDLLSHKLDTTGGTMTGTLNLKSVVETKVAMGANDIDLSAGSVFTKTISTSTTLTVSNNASSGSVDSFILELTNASTNVTWFSGVKWNNGNAPILSTTGVDILGFYSHDGGTTWRGQLLAKDSK